MSILDAMTIDPAQTAETKNAIIRAFHASVMAAQDYAEAALDAAMVCYRAAEAGSPVAVAYTAYAEIPRLTANAQKMVSTAAELSTIACALQESQDEDANEAYAEHLIDMSKTDKVSAMLEAVHRRMTVVNAAIPENPAPAARFKAEIFQPKE